MILMIVGMVLTKRPEFAKISPATKWTNSSAQMGNVFPNLAFAMGSNSVLMLVMKMTCLSVVPNLMFLVNLTSSNVQITNVFWRQRCVI
jgi:hypothetical protein